MSGFDSIYIIDVSHPATPLLINTVTITHTEFSGLGEMVIDGKTLYVRTPFGIEEYDITEPINPVFVNLITKTHANESGLEIDTVNHRLFSPWLTTLQEYTGYYAFNVSNPSLPQYLFSDSVQVGSGGCL